MKRLLCQAVAALLLSCGVALAAGDYLTGSGPAADVPLPAKSCLYIAQSIGGSAFSDRDLCGDFARALGIAQPTGPVGGFQTKANNNAFGVVVPDTGVTQFIQSAAGAIQAGWLAPGAALANLGFAPVPDSRSLTAGAGLTGGGDFRTDRSISLSMINPDAVLGNPTAGVAAPTAMSFPPCDDVNGRHLNFTSHTITCGSTGGGNVSGPGSSITDNVVTFASTTGKIVRDSGIPLSSVLIASGPLGTPSAANLLHGTNLPIDFGTTGTLPEARGGTGLTGLGAGVKPFLQVPTGAVQSDWLATTAVVDNLGFTPASAARAIIAGTGLVGGGDLSGDRALAIDNMVVTLVSPQTLLNKYLVTPTVILPTSCADIPNGSLYNNSGTPAICNTVIGQYLALEGGGHLIFQGGGALLLEGAPPTTSYLMLAGGGHLILQGGGALLIE